MTDMVDLYGMLDDNIDAASIILAKLLTIPFEPHDSDFWGEYYVTRNEDRTEKFSLKENFNIMEDDWNEPNFKDYPLTLEVSLTGPNAVTRARELEERILKTQDIKIALLNREEFPSEEP